MLELHSATQLDGGSIDAHVETRGELRRPQHAQRVFAECAPINMLNHAGAQIDKPAVGVGNITRQHILIQRIHGEIAAAGSLFDAQRRIDLHFEVAVPLAYARLGTRKRHIDIVAEQFVDAERLANPHHGSEFAQNALELLPANPMDFDVEVFGLAPQNRIAHATAHEIRAPAPCRNRPSELSRTRNLGRVQALALSFDRSRHTQTSDLCVHSSSLRIIRKCAQDAKGRAAAKSHGAWRMRFAGFRQSSYFEAASQG